MSINIRIPTPLRAYVGGAREVSGEAGAVNAVLAALVDAHPDLGKHIFNEEGNVRSIRQDLVRGHTDSTLGGVGSGCGCSMPGGTREGQGGALAVLLGLGGLGLIALRRRSNRSTASFSRLLGGTRAASITVATVGLVAASSQGCSCGSEADDRTGCGDDCNSECQPGLNQGMPGAYTSVAKAPDGALWVVTNNTDGRGDPAPGDDRILRFEP